MILVTSELDGVITSCCEFSTYVAIYCDQYYIKTHDSKP